MKVTIQGEAAGNFFAERFVNSDGAKALDKMAKGGPMYKAVKEELKRRGIPLHIEDGKECSIGCKNHVTHPCEKCGRIQARGDRIDG